MLRLFGRLSLLLGLLLGLKGIAWWLYQPVRRFVPCDSSYKSVQFDSLRTSYNAVFIGSSRTFMSVIPGQFDSLTGRALRTYNYGVAECFAPHSFRLTESLLRRPDLSLQYVFLELSLPNAKLPEEPFLLNPLIEVSYRARLWSVYADLVGGPTLDSWANSYALSVLSPRHCLHHSLPTLLSGASTRLRMAKPLNAEDLPYDFIYSPDGYLRDKRLRPTVWKADVALLPKIHRLARQAFNARPAQPLNDAYWADVANLLRLAEARHIRLMVYLPNRLSPVEARWLPAVFRRIPAANRLTVYPDSRFDSLFSPSNSFNKGHLNHHGAQQYTTLLAEAFRRVTTPVTIARNQRRTNDGHLLPHQN